jgi:hypothetical protein
MRRIPAFCARLCSKWRLAQMGNAGAVMVELALVTPVLRTIDTQLDIEVLSS